MNIYRIADLNIAVENHSDFTKEYMREYLTEKTDFDFVVTVTDDMIKKEIEISAEEIPFKYYEITAVFRAICYVIVEKYNGFFLHCSSLMYENNAYIFTAKSGTGKSTHASLWRKVLKDKVTMINDDKPIVRLIDGKFYIYGTPWDGKHRISSNVKAPIKAIYYLHQSKENKVVRCDVLSSVTKILSQTVLPNDKNIMNHLLNMIEKLVSDIPVYDLYCNISEDAVHTALNSIIEI